MSKVLWQNILIPNRQAPVSDFYSEAYQARVTRTQALPLKNEEIAIPDPRAFRSMSRASLLLSSVSMSVKELLAPVLSANPFAVGVYCAVENGPIDAPTTVKILEQGEAKFPEAYRKIRNPKLYLKQLPNLAPAQMGISLGLLGRMNVYTHSLSGAVQALEQAEWDLKSKRVSHALVCAAHAFDDYLVLKRSRSDNFRVLTEGAAALLLWGDENFTPWADRVEPDPEHYFGIAEPLINLIKGAENGKPSLT